MQEALKIHTTILQGHRIEASAPNLPEGADVELFVYLSDTKPYASQSEVSRSVALNREYEALIQTQWERKLTHEEVLRLQTVKADLDTLEEHSDAYQTWERRITTLQSHLAALRKEVEALPDAL